MPEVKPIFFSACTSVARSRNFGRYTSSTPTPVWTDRSGPCRSPSVSNAWRRDGSPHNAMSPIRQGLLGMAPDEGVSFGPERGRQHPARHVARDLGQRVINRFRLTQSDDVCIFRHAVSFLLEVLAGLDTRHDTPPSPTPSPRFTHSLRVADPER
jgi:hypothetical protein